MRAACSTSEKSTFTPTLMLGDSTTGTLAAAASTRARTAAVKPVEPMTRGTPRPAQVSACPAETSKAVKSTTPWAREPSRARPSSSRTGTPAGRPPASVPASCPTAGPGRSVAPTSANPSVDWSRRMIWPPMRPAAPVTTTFTMLGPPGGGRAPALRKAEAEADHGLLDLGEVLVRDRRQRQPQLAARLAEPRHRRLDRARVGLHEHHAVELRHGDLKLERPGVIAGTGRHHQVLHGPGGDVGHYRDDAVSAAGDVGEHREVVAGEPGDSVLAYLLHQLDLALHARGGLLDADDGAGLRQPRHRLGQEVHRGAAGDFVGHHREAGGLPDGEVVPVEPLLGGLVVVGGHHQ